MVMANQICPEKRWSAQPGLTNTKDEFVMATTACKPILCHIEGPKGAAIIERFTSKVDRRGPDECWDWMASFSEKGYGRFKIASWQMVHTNRVALVIETRTDPIDLQALHSCDRPICCNPAHLRWGTHNDNMQDMKERGRHRSPGLAGERNPRAKLTDADIERIVRYFQSGMSNVRIARQFSVTHSMISLIRLGRMWRPQTQALGWVPPTKHESRVVAYTVYATTPGAPL